MRVYRAHARARALISASAVLDVQSVVDRLTITLHQTQNAIRKSVFRPTG
jgi:hypothetical protein